MIARCEEVIITDLLLRGSGTNEDPYRRVVQVWSKDGNLIAENDPIDNENKQNRTKWNDQG